MNDKLNKLSNLVELLLIIIFLSVLQLGVQIHWDTLNFSGYLLVLPCLQASNGAISYVGKVVHLTLLLAGFHLLCSKLSHRLLRLFVILRKITSSILIDKSALLIFHTFHIEFSVRDNSFDYSPARAFRRNINI